MDNIANMLTIIRNGQAVEKETVVIPYSKLKLEIAKILEKEKFIKSAEAQGKKNKKTIDVELAYEKDGSPAIKKIKRVSKSSQRIYMPLKKIFPVQYGKGIWIISTPKGMMTDKEARKEKVGGEIICEVW
ncbi:MAG: 30S ribosomal protein S8 [Candidatus Paceibacterota bacterium]